VHTSQSSGTAARATLAKVSAGSDEADIAAITCPIAASEQSAETSPSGRTRAMARWVTGFTPSAEGYAGLVS